jgi:hypothetical protein
MASYDVASNIWQGPFGEGISDEGEHEKAAWALRRGLDTAVNLVMDPPPPEPVVFAPDALPATRIISSASGWSGAEGEGVVAVGGDGIDFAQLFDFSKAEMAGRWRQGLTLVHFSAQRKRFLWDVGCTQGLLRGRL